MHKGRLETFSDGVIAIIITIMVLDLKVPHGDDLVNLSKLWPIFLSYAMSFIKIGIYWKNHHALLQTIQRVNNRIVWSNLHWLFWLSLLPFTTGWMGMNNFAPLTVATYSLNLLLASLAYGVLRVQVLREQEDEYSLARESKGISKGSITIFAYAIAFPAALLGYAWVSGVIIVAIAVMWLVTDYQVEKRVKLDQ
jgi:uncharacterized membrane protein